METGAVSGRLESICYLLISDRMNDKIGELIHMLTCHDDKVLTDDDEVNEMWDVSQISEIWSTYWWMWMDRIVHVPADAPDIWICITRCIVATKNEDVLQEMWLALKTLMANKVSSIYVLY